jgi:hypothetical protein
MRITVKKGDIEIIIDEVGTSKQSNIEYNHVVILNILKEATNKIILMK